MSLPHTRFDQISYHKHEIYLYVKLPIKLLPQAAVAFFFGVVLEVTVRKSSKQTLS